MTTNELAYNKEKVLKIKEELKSLAKEIKHSKLVFKKTTESNF